jgi:hypothetical protein
MCKLFLLDPKFTGVPNSPVPSDADHDAESIDDQIISEHQLFDPSDLEK